jgi:hypothetical protein
MSISINIIIVQLSYLGITIGLFLTKIHHVYYKKKNTFFLLFPFSHFSQMRKTTHLAVLGQNDSTIKRVSDI